MCSSNAKKDVLVDTHSLQAKTEVVDKLDPQMKPQQLPRTTSIGLERLDSTLAWLRDVMPSDRRSSQNSSPQMLENLVGLKINWAGNDSKYATRKPRPPSQAHQVGTRSQDATDDASPSAAVPVAA